jgi:hypothetical protein
LGQSFARETRRRVTGGNDNEKVGGCLGHVRAGQTWRNARC